MDSFQVYKVETISDSYLVASGLPQRNGDRHAVEICDMSLSLRRSCMAIERPDRVGTHIEIKAGIHTGDDRHKSLSGQSCFIDLYMYSM